MSSIESLLTGPLRYNWLQFVPVNEQSNFFSPTQESILTDLAKRPVLEAWNKSLAAPSTLVYVPKEFLDHDGVPFSLCPETESRYLSARYPDSEFEILQKLGTKRLSEFDFLADLEQMVENHHEAFRAKSEMWHTQLSKALLPLLAIFGQKQTIRGMKIIPLSDGQWVTASSGTLFLSTKSNTPRVPDGISVQLIDRSAEAAPHRRNLFELLGAQKCDVVDICRLIVKKHNESDFDAKTIPRNQLITHATYLYEAKWQSEKGMHLWFATKRGGRAQASGLYMRAACNRGSPLAMVYDELDAHSDFIHEDYFVAYPKDRAAWLSWLEKEAGIATIPRLVPGPANDSKAAVLSEDFKLLLQRCNSRDIFGVVRDNWSFYARWLENDDVSWQSTVTAEGTKAPIGASLRNELKKQRVKYDGRLVALSTTVLPMIDTLVDISQLVPTIDVYDPHSLSWKILRFFGVAVEKNAEYYVRCLEAQKAYQRPVYDVIAHLYGQLRELMHHYGEVIRYPPISHFD